jgi:hypothetical protein
METQRRDRTYILKKAYNLGKTALVDPVPELWDENVGRASRAETMRIYFEGLAEQLQSEYERASGERVTPEFRNEILNEMERGFEKLMDEQPGYHQVSKESVTPEIRAEILEVMEKVFEAMVAEKLRSHPDQEEGETETDIWIEKEDALKFVKEVFEQLKYKPVS